MIHILPDRNDPITTELVLRAFQRVFTPGQVRSIGTGEPLPTVTSIVVALSPDDASAPAIAACLQNGSKVIVQGVLGPALAAVAGIEAVSAGSDLVAAAACEPAATHATAESRAAVSYTRSGLGASSPLHQRRFCRFDFTSEWNNLGYGRITAGKDRWAIRQFAKSWEHAVAAITLDGARSPGAAVTLRDALKGALLWFARPVGPIDGPDWSVVESFVSAYRAGDLPCRPYLREIPHGYGAAVTMRLDCDEDIASARPLLELYRARGRPLSLAIMTGQPENPAHFALIEDVRAANGSILSHSASHAPNWGGSAESAAREATVSKNWLESRIPGLTVRYAVSPFHQNPAYVPAALAGAGYDGFVGGAIASDPEYMMARAGVPPFAPSGVISHTQSCMLHGDCLLREKDPLRIFKEAFALARNGGQFFGYLDHPFSERYAYGWANESARVAAHADFLDYMDIHTTGGPLLFVNEETCLDFIRAKAGTEILYDERTDTYRLTQSEAAGLPLSIGFHGRSHAA